MSKYTYHKDILNRNGQVIGRRVDTVPDNVVKQIKADAYDEFADNIKKYYASKKEMGYVATTYENLIFYIDELTERLKKGIKE